MFISSCSVTAKHNKRIYYHFRTKIQKFSEHGNGNYTPLDVRAFLIRRTQRPTVVLRWAGRVYSVGSNVEGQLGIGDRKMQYRCELTLVEGALCGRRCVSVGTGSRVSFAVTSEGFTTIWCRITHADYRVAQKTGPCTISLQIFWNSMTELRGWPRFFAPPCMSVGVGRIFESIWLSVCLFVCLSAG